MGGAGGAAVMVVVGSDGGGMLNAGAEQPTTEAHPPGCSLGLRFREVETFPRRRPAAVWRGSLA